MINNHSKGRIGNRLLKAGVIPRVIHPKIEFELLMVEPGEAVAVLVMVLEEQVNEAWSEKSNGDEVWTIIRNQKLVTLMLRRHTQPKTPLALKVDRVVIR